MFKFTWIKDFISFLATFPNILSENSTKLLALLISAITGGFVVGAVIPFILIWDVCTNGYIKTDLIDCGVFIVCIGAMMLGAGYNIEVPSALKGRIKARVEKKKEKEEGEEV